MSYFYSFYFFKTLVSEGSFTSAADMLKTSSASVSRQLKDLESQLGTRLLNRTTRTLSLTQSGKVFFESCCRILEEVRTTESLIHDLSAKPVGILKLTSTPAFANKVLMKAIAEFNRSFPDIQFELMVSDEYVDLIKEGLDLALRMGELNDSRLIARPLLRGWRVPCASRAYLEQQGYPETLEELSQHALIYPANMQSIVKLEQSLMPGVKLNERQKRLKVNDFLAIYEAVKRGMGLTWLPTYLIDDDLKNGTLVELFHGKRRTPYEINLIYPHAQFLPHKTKVFMQFLLEFVHREGLNGW